MVQHPLARLLLCGLGIAAHLDLFTRNNCLLIHDFNVTLVVERMLQQSIFDVGDALHDLVGLVIPHDEDSAVSNEGCELVLLAGRKVRNIREHLDAKLVLDLDVGESVVVQNCLDHTRVDGHGDLSGSCVSSREPNPGVYETLTRTFIASMAL